MTQPVIRRAGRSDAAALSAIARATFTEAFGDRYPPADLAAYLDQAYEIDRTRAHLADPATAAWLIEAEGEIVGHAGYACAGPDTALWWRRQSLPTHNATPASTTPT